MRAMSSLARRPTAADGEAVEADLFEPGQRLVAQVFVHAALDDPEQAL
jgi:hypothetical protein